MDQQGFVRTREGDRTVTDTAEFLADRLGWVFRRTGAPGQSTRAFSELPEADQLRLRTSASVAPGEVPVLAHNTTDQNEWVVLTTERLVWSTSGRIESVRCADIREATIDSVSLRDAGSAGKAGLRTLAIVMANGQVRHIDVEPGPPFSGFWNVVKTIADGNRSKSG
jgi:hypothetical protein